MIFRTNLTRFNLEHKPIPFDSREYGYLILLVEYLDIDEDGVTRRVVPPVKIRFVPDPKLSVNQLMEFKKLHTDMRLYLSRNQADGCLKVSLRDGKLFFTICHYTSEMEVPVDSVNFDQIRQILDELSIVISTNTFFQLDLKEIRTNTGRQLNEWKGYLMNFLPH